MNTYSKKINTDEKLSFPFMKKEIQKMGGLLCQYRSCARDVYTIYDIENLRNGVVYARSPLYMNDPFDSMIGFSEEKVYNEIINLVLDALHVEEQKPLLTIILKFSVLDKFSELVNILKEIRNTIDSYRKQTHQTNTPINVFIINQLNKIYKLFPSFVKQKVSTSDFKQLAGIITAIYDLDITEETVTSIIGLKDQLSMMQNAIKEIKNNAYFPKFKEFLSRLTISCFSSSSWNNPLMWSHYANSYSGMCVEYDFNKMNNFIGFVYPVEYSKERPNILLEDVGINSQIFEKDENGGLQISKKLSYTDNLEKLFSYLLVKDTCWNYEKEWRIINIGEPNTNRFVNTNFIKSITFGPRMNDLCKQIILDICKEKDIECYNLILSQEDFSLTREKIDLDNIEFNIDKEQEYIEYLNVDIERYHNKMNEYLEMFNKSNAEGTFKVEFLNQSLESFLNIVCDAFYIKLIINRILNQKIDSEELKLEIKQTIIAIDNAIDENRQPLIELKDSIKVYQLNNKNFITLNKCLCNIESIIEKYDNIKWNLVN